MTGKRVYLQPRDMVLGAIHDLEELQKGTLTSCDTAGGFVSFRVSMYASEWEYRFTVTDIGWNRCGVTIAITEDTPYGERLIDNEFALLDYVLIDRAKLELEQLEEQDRGVRENRKSKGRI